MVPREYSRARVSGLCEENCDESRVSVSQQTRLLPSHRPDIHSEVMNAGEQNSTVNDQTATAITTMGGGGIGDATIDMDNQARASLLPATITPSIGVRAETLWDKERCRTNQARYRHRQRAHRNKLEATVVKLREEVGELEQRYRALSFRVYSKHSLWSIVVEYFRLFRHGISSFAGSNHQSAAPISLALEAASTVPSWTGLMRSSPTRQTQIEFLKAAMATNVELVGSDDYGVDALVDHWLRWARCFQDVELHLDQIEKAPGVADALLATGRIGAAITAVTVRKLFSHFLVSDPSDRQLDRELIRQLSDHNVEFRLRVCFECDPHSNQVQRLRLEIEVVPAIYRLVGSLEKTARVLECLPLTSSGFIQHSSV